MRLRKWRRCDNPRHFENNKRQQRALLADFNWCKFTLIIKILFFTITMLPECRRCGECCRWVVLQNIQPNSDDIEYYTCRGWKYNPVTENVWIQNICPHLQPDSTCEIYEKRPRLCAMYPDRNIPLPRGCVFSTERVL